MKYNGVEVTEFTSDEQVAFNPPKKMLVWDDNIEVREDLVYAYIPKRFMHKVIGHSCAWTHCAEIPQASKPRRATNFELMKWLANGNGQVSENDCISVWMTHAYTKNKDHNACDKSTMVRKWGDKKWHEPTTDYMGLEAK